MADTQMRDEARDADALTEKTMKSRRHFYQLWSLVAICGLVWVLGLLLDILAVPVSIVVWTTVIVFCLHGVVEWLERRGIGRGLGTTIAFVIMFLVILAILALIFLPMFGLGDQFSSMIASIPDTVNNLTAWVNQMYQDNIDFFQNDTVKSWVDSLTSSLGTWASSLASDSASNVVEFGTNIANAALIIGFSLFIAFWILMELPDLAREVQRLVGPKYEDEFDLFNLTFTRVLGGYIRALLLQCLLIGVGATIVYICMGISNPAALGIITGIMNIIPVIGPWIGGAIAAVGGIVISPLSALITVLLIVVIQTIVYNFLQPLIVRDSVDIHPVLNIMALMVGSAIGGTMSGLVGSLVGMLVSVPLVAIAKSLFIYHFERKTGRQLVATDGVFFQGDPITQDDGTGSHDAVLDAVAVHTPQPGETSRIILGKASTGEHTDSLTMRMKRINLAKEKGDSPRLRDEDIPHIGSTQDVRRGRHG